MNDIKDTNGLATVFGQPTLKVAVTGADVFIGIGPAKAVDAYLAGAAVDQVKDLDVDPFKLTTVPRRGSGQPAPPGSQDFWTVRASGAHASFDWKISDGSYRLVLMNADASPGVDANGRVGLTVDHLFGIGIGILIGGVLVTLIGIWLIILGVRTRLTPPPAMPMMTEHRVPR
jgi:hypothetical protein